MNCQRDCSTTTQSLVQIRRMWEGGPLREFAQSGRPATGAHLTRTDTLDSTSATIATDRSPTACIPSAVSEGLAQLTHGCARSAERA